MPDDVHGELFQFTMPSLGADMDAGTVLEWHVSPGATVHRGDVIAIVQTDKSDLDVEVFADGTVVELLVPPGEKVAVGTTLALLAPLGHVVATSPAAAASAAVATTVPTKRVEAAPAPHLPDAQRPVPPKIDSPVLRHLADVRHVDLGHIAGSGVGGRITRDDVERAAARRRVTPRARRLAREHGVDLDTLSGALITGDAVLSGAAPVPSGPLPAPAKTPPLAPVRHGEAGMRTAIARVMARAWREIPHYRVETTIDVHHALAALDALNAPRPAAERVLPAALFASAAARAARIVPGVNGHWVDDGFMASPTVNIAVVVALRSGGLLAPVIRDADTKGLDACMEELRDLVTRARSGRLTASEVSGATFTITQLGEGGVASVAPIIHPPQVAILGLGAVREEPWAENGMLAVRPVVHASLAGDHRAIDGRLGSLYLTTFNRLLQEPITP